MHRRHRLIRSNMSNNKTNERLIHDADESDEARNAIKDYKRKKKLLAFWVFIEKQAKKKIIWLIQMCYNAFYGAHNVSYFTKWHTIWMVLLRWLANRLYEIRIRSKKGKICMKERPDGEMNWSFARAIRDKGKILFWSFCGWPKIIERAPILLLYMLLVSFYQANA